MLWMKLDPALGSAVVFFLPCFGLAILPPYMVRIAARRLENVGSVSGYIYAMSTAGSIAGVFVSGYILIDQLTVTQIFRATGVLTLVLAASSLGLDAWPRREASGSTPTEIKTFSETMKTSVTLLKLAFVLAVALVTQTVRAQVIFERISAYHHILVYDDAATQVRTLSFNGSWETKMSLTNPLTGHFEYTEIFPDAVDLEPRHQARAQWWGWAAAAYSARGRHYYTNVLADTVEIDPVVVEVAHKYSGVTESPNLVIHTNDGRVFLRRTTNTYDVILMDAYATTQYGSLAAEAPDHEGIFSHRAESSHDERRAGAYMSSARFTASARTSSARCTAR